MHIVYYFSGTGNSLTVAKEIEAQGALVSSIASEMRKSQKNGTPIIKCDADKVGFVFPLYYLGLPKMVHEFLEKLVLTKATYVYMVCTMVCACGNIEIIDGKPVWKHNCESCLACFHYCPNQAILYQGKGEDIPHYHHPDVSVAESERYRKMNE